MFWRPPSNDDLAVWGGARVLEDFPEPECEVWDEIHPMLVWFRSMMSQFVYNGFGATGFNYAVAYRDFDDMELQGVERDKWKWTLKVMESEALHHFNKPA